MVLASLPELFQCCRRQDCKCGDASGAHHTSSQLSCQCHVINRTARQDSYHFATWQVSSQLSRGTRPTKILTLTKKKQRKKRHFPKKSTGAPHATHSLLILYFPFTGTATNTCHARHTSIGQRGRHGNDARCRAEEASSHDAGPARTETSVPGVARYVRPVSYDKKSGAHSPVHQSLSLSVSLSLSAGVTLSSTAGVTLSSSA